MKSSPAITRKLLLSPLLYILVASRPSMATPRAYPSSLPIDEVTPLLPTTINVVAADTGRTYDVGKEHDGEFEAGPWAPNAWRWVKSRALVVSFTMVCFTSVFVLAMYARSTGAWMSPKLAGKRTIPVPTEIQSLWGAYTPYLPVVSYEPPPDQCAVTQVSPPYH